MIRTPDGLLLVDKPAGVSSHDMVMAARRALGERRIGHSGTLDPFATGLLVLLVGRATRLLPYVPGEPKVYDATIVFGAETDTDDLHGTVVSTGPSPSQTDVLAAVGEFVGEVDQVPSSYSAKRVGGRRAYAIARAGNDPQLASVRVRIDAFEVKRCALDGDAVTACDVRVVCNGGTYVRAIARDLGRRVGSAAHLAALRRERSGPFDVSDASTLEHLRDGAVTLRPALDALPHLPRQVLTDDEVPLIARGVEVPATVHGDHAALLNPSTGVLVALGERRGDRWQPRVVMRPALQTPEPV